MFFTVPCHGSASSHFKIMLQAAQKLSKALDAQLLDQHRNPLTDQAIRHTMNKVLEFERQQFAFRLFVGMVRQVLVMIEVQVGHATSECHLVG